jgi:hypothetical protein
MPINPDEMIDPVALEVTIPADIRSGVAVALQRRWLAFTGAWVHPLDRIRHQC